MYKIYKVKFTKENNKHIYNDNIKGCEVIKMGLDSVIVKSTRRLKGTEVQDLEKETLLLDIESSNDSDKLRDNKKTLLSLFRYRKEIKGIELNGLTIPTDRQSQSMINGAYSTLKNDLITEIDFKCSTWVTMTLVDIEPIAQNVANHVQKCFKAERQVSETLDTIEDIETLRSYDLNNEFIAKYDSL